MRKQMAIESEGLGGIASAREVNDESACLVEDFKCTINDLQDFAKHYLDKAKEIEFYGRFLGYSGSYEIRMLAFARRRLATIENVLGKERVEKALVVTAEKWDRVFAQAEEIEKNLKPCKACGRKRSYHDHVLEPDGYCSEECFEVALRGSGKLPLEVPEWPASTENPAAVQLLADFKPTRYELALLANDTLDQLKEIDFIAIFLRSSGSREWRMSIHAPRFLATIENVLGEERYQKAIASTKEEWDKIFAEAEEVEKNLEPCKQCGAKRGYYDYAMSFVPDGYCGACGGRAEAALGEDRFQKALASTEEEWEKIFAEADEIERNLEPCNACGGKRDIRDYAYIPDGYCRACNRTVIRLNSGSVTLNATRKFRACGGT